METKKKGYTPEEYFEGKSYFTGKYSLEDLKQMGVEIPERIERMSDIERAVRKKFNLKERI